MTRKTCLAFQRNDTGIDLESLAENHEEVKTLVVKAVMGWRYEFPDRYSREEVWERIMQHGKIVPVAVEVLPVEENE